MGQVALCQAFGVLLVTCLLQCGLLSISAFGERVAEPFKNSYGHFFRVVGFGNDAPSMYNSSIMKSACGCLRRCQVSPLCMSVTAVPLTPSEIECRTCTKNRPQLTRIPGAIHYLQIGAGKWRKPEDDGLFYSLRMSNSTNPKCSGRYRYAKTISQEQLEVFKKFIVEDGTYVPLHYRTSGDELRWGRNYAEAIPYSNLSLDPSLVEDFDKSSDKNFKMVMVNGELKFVVGNDTDNIHILCQVNDLNIIW